MTTVVIYGVNGVCSSAVLRDVICHKTAVDNDSRLSLLFSALSTIYTIIRLLNVDSMNILTAFGVSCHFREHFKIIDINETIHRTVKVIILLAIALLMLFFINVPSVISLFLVNNIIKLLQATLIQIVFVLFFPNLVFSRIFYRTATQRNTEWESSNNLIESKHFSHMFVYRVFCNSCKMIKGMLWVQNK